MDFLETKCPQCEGELESQKDNEVKVCNTCKLRWHYRDDDNTWRCYSIDPLFELSHKELINKIHEMKSLLQSYEEWEAMLISDNNFWWPHADKDCISGKSYDKMLELQEKRNDILHPGKYRPLP